MVRIVEQNLPPSDPYSKIDFELPETADDTGYLLTQIAYRLDRFFPDHETVRNATAKYDEMVLILTEKAEQLAAAGFIDLAAKIMELI